VELELLRRAFKAPLVDARQKTLQRAHIHIPLELVAGHPHTKPFDLVQGGILVHFLLAVVLQRTLERQRLYASESRGIEALDVRLERLEERVVDEKGILLLLLPFGLLLAFPLLLVLALRLPLRLGKKRGEIGVLARALWPAPIDHHATARAVGRVWLWWCFLHGIV